MTERKKMDKAIRGICIFFIVFSFIFMGVGGLLISVDRSQQAECAETAQGTIVEIQKSRSIKKWRHRPVVEYLGNGEKVRAISTLSKSSTNLKVGDSVVVHYSPRTGEMWIEGYDDRFILLLGVAFAFTGTMIGLLVLVAGILGRRGRVLKGVIIFFAAGEGLLLIKGMVEGFRGSNKQDMLLQFIVASVIACLFLIFKLKKDRQSKKSNDEHLISDHEPDQQ